MTTVKFLKTNLENKAQFSVLFQASQTSEDIYVVVVKSSGYSVFGRAKVMSYNIAGAINSIAYAVTFLSIDPECNPDQSQRDQLAEFARLAGLPALTL